MTPKTYTEILKALCDSVCSQDVDYLMDCIAISEVLSGEEKIKLMNLARALNKLFFSLTEFQSPMY